MAMVSEFKGMDFLYFTARNINMKTGKIRGRMLINNEWLRVVTDIPKVIDVSTFCGKHKKEINYLRERSYLTEPMVNRISKMDLQSLLNRSTEFEEYSIPTCSLSTFNQLVEWLDKYSRVVVKPINSRRGRNVYKIEKQSNCFKVGIKMEEKEIQKEDLRSLFTKEFKDKSYIIQKEMTSRTESGDPFACRVHLEKDSQAK